MAMCLCNPLTGKASMQRAHKYPHDTVKIIVSPLLNIRDTSVESDKSVDEQAILLHIDCMDNSGWSMENFENYERISS